MSVNIDNIGVLTDTYSESMPSDNIGELIFYYSYMFRIHAVPFSLHHLYQITNIGVLTLKDFKNAKK